MPELVYLLLGLLTGLMAGVLLAVLFFWSRLQQAGRQATELKVGLARAQEAESQARSQLERREAELRRNQEQVRAEVELLAGRIVEQGAKRITDDTQTRLDGLLQPLRERLQSFEKRVEDTYQQEARERFSLQKEIGKLVQLNVEMGEEARNLTRALKGDPKVRGNWGELILTRLLESCGLREGEEYVVQGKDLGLSDGEGRRLQPDVILRLPDNKHLIVDAKLSLVAYEQYVEATDEKIRSAALKRHLDSVMLHISQLSAKHYPSLEGLESPDFVLLFMPIEPAFSLAIESRNDLFSYAWERNIVIVSPSTLLATLRTVASVWKLEHQNRNAQEIARLGGLLYDKFVGFTEEMEKVGKSIERASAAHADALSKLSQGPTSLSARAEKLRELGVKTHKTLPPA
ncbi:MAG: DNA recombination protein RmuC [Bacteroidetes bacterium]|nr:MAG: DNA recombination protein RmuC [Bacteroidota bacterium]